MKVNTVSYFEIQSSNPERDMEFYFSLFNRAFIKNENFSIGYYRIETNTINGRLLKRPDQTPLNQVGTNAFVCSIQVESFDKTSEQILKPGRQITMSKFAITGSCCQGYFLDQDNNTFGIFEVDLNAK